MPTINRIEAPSTPFRYLLHIPPVFSHHCCSPATRQARGIKCQIETGAHEAACFFALLRRATLWLKQSTCNSGGSTSTAMCFLSVVLQACLLGRLPNWFAVDFGTLGIVGVRSVSSRTNRCFIISIVRGNRQHLSYNSVLMYRLNTCCAVAFALAATISCTPRRTRRTGNSSTRAVDAHTRRMRSRDHAFTGITSSQPQGQ